MRQNDAGDAKYGCLSGNAKLNQSLSDILLNNFPSEEDFRKFEENFYPEEYRNSPSTVLMRDPARQALLMIVRYYIWSKQASNAEYELLVSQGALERICLEINGVKFPLNLELLMIIADYCIDDTDESASLAEAIFAYNFPMLMGEVLWTGFIDNAEMDKAWLKRSYDLCEKLLNAPGFFYSMTDAQAEDIMNMNDSRLLQSAAQRLHGFYLYWDKLEKRRISAETRDRLMAFLSACPDADVRRLLIANSDGIPGRFQAMYNGKQKGNELEG